MVLVTCTFKFGFCFAGNCCFVTEPPRESGRHFYLAGHHSANDQRTVHKPHQATRGGQYYLVPLLLLHCWVIVRYVHTVRIKVHAWEYMLKDLQKGFFKLQIVEQHIWHIMCIKIYYLAVHVPYILSDYIFFYCCKKWRNTCKAIVKWHWHSLK